MSKIIIIKSGALALPSLKNKIKKNIIHYLPAKIMNYNYDYF